MVAFTKPVLASRLVLTQAGSRSGDRGLFDEILSIEVFINGGKKPGMLDMNEDQMAATILDLPRRMRIKSIRIRILSRLPGRRPFEAGFSEIALMQTPKKSAR